MDHRVEKNSERPNKTLLKQSRKKMACLKKEMFIEFLSFIITLVV